MDDEFNKRSDIHITNNSTFNSTHNTKKEYMEAMIMMNSMYDREVSYNIENWVEDPNIGMRQFCHILDQMTLQYNPSNPSLASNVNVGSLYGTLDDGCGVKVEGEKGGKGDDDKSYRVGVITDPIQKSEPKHHPNTWDSNDDNIPHIIEDTILDSGADNDTLAGIHKHKYNNIHGVDNVIMKGITGSSKINEMGDYEHVEGLKTHEGLINDHS